MAHGELVKGNGAVSAATMEKVLVGGDLAALSPAQRLEYYRATCESMGLNPLSKPFDYIKLSGRLTLYARKDATDQLRKIHGVSIVDVQTKLEDGLLTITVKGEDKDGRKDVDVGAVYIKGLTGDNLANATKKAVTQAKRRLTLSLCGLGWLDETETTQIADAKPVAVAEDSGEIIDEKTGEVVEEARPEVISPAQAKRMWALARKAWGLPATAEETLRHLLGKYGYESTADVLRSDYDGICDEIQAAGNEVQP